MFKTTLSQPVLVLPFMALLFMAGCRSSRPAIDFSNHSSRNFVAAPTSTEIESPLETKNITPSRTSKTDLATADVEDSFNRQVSFEAPTNESLSSGISPANPEPWRNQKTLPESFEFVTLDRAIEIALCDTKILRGLSANVVRNPAGVGSAFDPAIQAADANFGIDAALAQFDSALNSSALYANNDDFFNNPSTTANVSEVQQNLTTLNLGVDRVAQTGTRFSLNSGLIHDDTTNPSVFFPSSWEYRLEASVRQPLLQGRGTLFNQIAGPNSRPGFLGTSGLLVSRTNHQISISEFQNGINNLILEIVEAYWQLDLAYENYETIRAARDASRKTWEAAKARFDQGLPGGGADREAQARGQYYQFELRLDQALNSNNQTGTQGLLQAEANLRRLLNLPQAGNVLIRPSDRPSNVGSVIDWDQLSATALQRRVEIQQQNQRIYQRDLELIAAKNFLLPRLDALATYRNSGLGNDLINRGGKFSGALNEAWDGNYDEWEFGVTYDVPVGFRQAKAGVRNASLKAARERAVLQELKNQILHDLGTALRGLEQTSNSIRIAELRYEAAEDTLKAREAAYQADAVTFEDLLDSQQRVVEAQLELHNVKTDRELALTRLYLESGSLLDEFEVSTD